MTDVTPQPDRPSDAPVAASSDARFVRILLAILLAGSFALKLVNLGHASIKPLDEAFHAIVAENFLRHPLTPTLNDGPTIPTSIGDWQNSHIWLHKPPMAMWQIAVSYAILGINTFALRFPSAILATLAVWLTFLIGRELLDSTAGLVAAALQALNPPIMMIVNGYVFSDHVDISLLFWTEASIFLFARTLRTRRSSDAILCGVAQGLAFLSKSYPALIVMGLCIVAWVLPRPNLRARHLLTIVAATIATILPWTLIALIRWPDQFIFENIHALRHLNENIEQWGAPWDRLVFDYWIRIFYLYYPAIIAATIYATVHAIRRSDGRVWLVLAWTAGVLAPNLLAESKTMTATLIGWPALWVLIGFLISQAIHRDRWALGIWLVAMLLALLIRKSDFPAEGASLGYPSVQGFAVIMREHLWVVWHVVSALIGGGIIATVARDRFRWAMIGTATLAMLLLSIQCWGYNTPRGYGYLAWRVTQIQPNAPDFRTLGKKADAELPANAVLLVEEQTKLENKLIQFWAHRTSYPVRAEQVPAIVPEIIKAGGVPYLISSHPTDLPALFTDPDSGRTVYSLARP